MKDIYKKKLRKNRIALAIQIIITLLIAVIIAFISISSIKGQARQYTDDVENDYSNLMKSYTRTFDVAYQQIVDKIKENPSFNEMDSWLKSKDKTFAVAMGSDIYDGIAISYKGGYAHSWNYGDYSDYDATKRPWYKAAEQGKGKTTIVAPYVTFLDSQYLNDDSYILMSVVRKYNKDISFDYDIKIKEIKNLLKNREQLYKGVDLLIYDKDGYILSSNNDDFFAHNVYKPDKKISNDIATSLKEMEKNIGVLKLKTINNKTNIVYMEKDSYGNRITMSIPLFAAVQRNMLAIFLIVLLLIAFELYLFVKNKRSILEFDSRDERLSAVTEAFYDTKVYVDLDSMTFYGEKAAEKMFDKQKYEQLYKYLSDKVSVENEKAVMKEFISPEALQNSKEEMYDLKSKKFSMAWQAEDGEKEGAFEVSKIYSIIDGRKTVTILGRDVTEDALILKQAVAQAESASHAKGDFMSRMSHEIRTPLNAIIGYLDIATSEEENKNKLDHCLEQSKVASRHLLSIVNDVLDISSIESGRMKIAQEDFDLSELINSLTTIFYTQAKEKNVKFDVGIHDLTAEWVKGDSLRVNQILLNLLSNAIKFTPEGGKINLDIRQVGIHNGNVHMEFKVSDTGIGMSEEYKKRLFKPFEQEDVTTAQKYGGTGLGLSICNNLINIMNGSIEVNSKKGEGTTFKVMLPFQQTKQRNKEHLNTESFMKLRALVVDDEENTCDYVKKLLKRCGVKCDTVTSGKKAIRRVESRMASDYPYDFCILDWNMPEMNGLETARKIREISGEKMPIIIATGYDYSSIVDEAKGAGVSKIISKPLFQSTLLDMIVNTFGKYEPKENREETTRISLDGMKVLLAEDNEMNMEIAVDILTKNGLNVTQAVNGKEAVDIFNESPEGFFDAILMDIQMPILNGYEATKEIRNGNHPEAKTIPIIALTANAFAADVTAALSAGMNDHIAKPISYKQLFNSLNKFMKGNGKD